MNFGISNAGGPQQPLGVTQGRNQQASGVKKNNQLPSSLTTNNTSTLKMEKIEIRGETLITSPVKLTVGSTVTNAPKQVLPTIAAVNAVPIMSAANVIQAQLKPVSIAEAKPKEGFVEIKNFKININPTNKKELLASLDVLQNAVKSYSKEELAKKPDKQELLSAYNKLNENPLSKSDDFALFRKKEAILNALLTKEEKLENDINIVVDMNKEPKTKEEEEIAKEQMGDALDILLQAVKNYSTEDLAKNKQKLLSIFNKLDEHPINQLPDVIGVNERKINNILNVLMTKEEKKTRRDILGLESYINGIVTELNKEPKTKEETQKVFKDLKEAFDSAFEMRNLNLEKGRKIMGQLFETVRAVEGQLPNHLKKDSDLNEMAGEIKGAPILAVEMSWQKIDWIRMK